MLIFRKCLFAISATIFCSSIAWSGTATIDFSKTNQVIDGFGGSSAWSGALSDATMDGLYGNKANQIGLTILRLRIDPHGTSGWNDEKSNATKAKARGATVFATPWSPPESLKTNGNTVKGYIKTDKFASFVNWMKSFWTYVGSANVDIMSLENEPDYAQQITYEGCGWTAQNFADFCKTYAKDIGKPIMMPESFNYDFSLSDATLNDASAAANVTYIGGHLYGTSPKTYTKALNLGKHVWETEHYYDGDDGSTCMKFAKEVMDCMNCNFSAYVWWWMASSSGTQTAIISGGTPNHRGWVLGQFSKWVRPGYYRVNATYSPQSGVNVVAFKGDSNVVVAMNSNNSSQSVTFTFSGATVTDVHKYTSSQSKSGANDGTITATNNSFTATLDAQSVSTFVTKGNGTSVLGPTDKRYVAGKSYSNNVESNFIYLMNGKRSRMPLITGQRQIPNIYILPSGSTHVGITANKGSSDIKK